jgi:hypothetical protein
VAKLCDRFWSKVDKTDTCWLWTACCRPDGYGQFWQDGRMQRAHRLAFRDLLGAIPRRFVLDHLCRVRNCVNPDHLEIVTRGENIQRGGNAIKTQCPQGHPYASGNTYLRPLTGHRSCKQCNRDRYHARKEN